MTRPANAALTVPTTPADPNVPKTAGVEFLKDVALPTESEAWPRRKRLAPVDDYDVTAREVRRVLGGRPWVWSGRRVVFLCDMHADADAFSASLVASGCVARTGPDALDIELNDDGREALFLIGGDCFDKGPHNLRLLRAVGKLIQIGGDVKILAGNHDLRTYLGIAYAERKETRFAHLFVRMGKKTVALFEEVYREYVADTDDPSTHAPDDEIKARLFPNEDWYRDFPDAIRGLVPTPKIAKEVIRIREKCADLEQRYAEVGMTLGMVDRTLAKCRELFVEPDGEFHWLFDRMELVHREGSVLFAHAGVCDATASLLREEGVAGLNRWFRYLLATDLFELYHGPVGNVFRTKYRDHDWPMTDAGSAHLRRAGIGAIAHGHRNITRGQRLQIRHDILNFECDCSVDEKTRRIEGLKGVGAAATVFRPDGRILGISTDHDKVKVFDPSAHCDLMSVC